MKLTLSGFLSLVPLFSLVAAEPQHYKVDRLVSRHYQEHRLDRRDAGFANGGSAANAGKGKNGKLRNIFNHELSFYHINDVHACVSAFSFCDGTHDGW